MDYTALMQSAIAFVQGSPKNHVQAEDAIRDDLIGLRLYDAPVFAVGDAEDPLFAALRNPEAVHPEYMLPTQWVPGAKRVLSFFLPYTERIRLANAQDMRMPADEWLHGRLEGEAMVTQLRLFLRDRVVESGYAAIAPFHDAQYTMLEKFAPNWSERHTGYVCGLGTFSMSKGLITEKGVAGRLGSIVTDCPLPVTPRPYDSLYAYCNACGACAAHCPVKAIQPDRGMNMAKAHPPCSAFLDYTHSLPPKGKSGKQRYGCGKCQVGVPCTNRIPK